MADSTVKSKQGYWTEHSNIDMCGQGDVEIIGDWKHKYSIDDLKDMVVRKGYSAVTVSAGQPSFGHAALKKFNFKLTKEHCKPITTCCNHPCTIYIYHSGEASSSKEMAKQVKQKQEQPVDVEFVNGGVWTAYKNIDMCGQGDVEIIDGWQQKHSIDDLKRKVEEKGYSAFAISPNSQSFGHAALKKFSYNLTPLECKPTHYECIIYIWNKFGSDSSDAKSKYVGCKMTLVKRGSPQQAIFEDIEQLKEGKIASTKLSSHGGNVALGKMYYEERRHGEWGYIESQCVADSEEDTVYLQYVDNNYLKLVNLDLVLDVAFWKMHEGNTVNYVGGRDNDGPTKLGGGGRDWTLNSDGTISAKHHPHLVLGF